MEETGFSDEETEAPWKFSALIVIYSWTEKLGNFLQLNKEVGL